MSLKNKVVLITGAGYPNGIGAGIARCFAAEGAHIAITDLDGAPLETTAADLPGDALGIFADAANQESMRAAVDQVVDRFGGLDVLVNNAGIGGPVLEFGQQGSASAFAAMSDELWDTQLTSNLKTAFSSSHAAAPRMNDGGCIVNVASIAALGASATLPAYGTAKAGVVHLTKTLAAELAPRGIRVNCICPGLLWTRAWELLTSSMKERQPEFANMENRQIFDTIVERLVPLGGEQTPEDIGNLAVFYASDKARMITGQAVAVDGGITAVR